MSQYINARENIVTEAIDGLLHASGGTLTRLDGYPHIKVVVRTDWSGDKVALVSGGGSGHEPAHAGYVGRGMLAAAVCGDVFASPSVDAVLAGILAVTGSAGCLLVVKNYTGDRLNFGLAAERARALGLNVSMVVVDDDIALPDLPQARGVAGTLFVHKIAGALAEGGADLDTVTGMAEQVIAGVRSIGMSLDTCTLPGSPKEERISAGHAELGLGIHGEPGVEQIDFSGARQAIEQVIGKLGVPTGEQPIAVLLNNLGSTTPLEMSILAEELLRSKIGTQLTWMVGPAPLMTSLDMHGFSLSLLPMTQTMEEALQGPVSSQAWPPACRLTPTDIHPLPDGLQPVRPEPSAHPERKAFIVDCCQALIASESDLNTLDAKSGDGDTGSTLAGAARALQDSLERLPLADEKQLLRAIGLELAQTMGGSSGVLLAIYFTATGDAAASGHSRIDALQAGLARVREVGGANPGDRTFIDALQPALDAFDQGLKAAATAARTGANATSKITTARAGRSAYVRADQLAGHNDPGAEAVARLFEHMAQQTA